MEQIGLYKTRIVYLDLLRIISGLLVVMVHVSAGQIEKTPVTSGSYVITSAFNCLAFSGVALFVMISGALALDPDKETGIKKLLLHKTVRFFALYYIWKAIYQAVTMLEAGTDFTFANVKNEILLALLKQRGYYHLWFLPMIAIVYMAVPVIKKGVADQSVCRYFLSIFFIVELLFPTLFHYEFKFKYLFVDFFTSNDFYLFGGYLGYFILGHYLHNWSNNISKRTQSLLYAAGGCGLILACVLETLASRRAGEPAYFMNTPFAAPLFFTVIAMDIAVQSVARRMDRRGRASEERTGKIFRFCADRVFGIYLLHPLVINLFSAIGFDSSVCSPVLSIPLVTVCVFIVSGMISFLLSQIPIVKNLIR